MRRFDYVTFSFALLCAALLFFVFGMAALDTGSRVWCESKCEERDGSVFEHGASCWGGVTYCMCLTEGGRIVEVK